jgi:hypothetical protein
VSEEEWIKTLEDGRRVKFTNRELPEDVTFLTAQVEGNQVVYSILLTHSRYPLRRQEVENHFASELSKKQRAIRNPAADRPMQNELLPPGLVH